jgi:hypothetical protein
VISRDYGEPRSQRGCVDSNVHRYPRKQRLSGN